MKYIRKFNETIAYHGKKNSDIFHIDDIGKQSTYFYLTTNYEYASKYSKDNILQFDIDETKLLNLKQLGIKKFKFSELRQKFNKLTNLFWPLQLQQLYKFNELSVTV